MRTPTGEEPPDPEVGWLTEEMRPEELQVGRKKVDKYDVKEFAR